MPPPPPPTSEAIPTLLRTPATVPANATPFFNRDLSWLEFNHRVLNEAADPRTPLVERIKFLAIYASNSDEFFMKRIGLLRRKLAQGSAERSHDGLTTEQHYQCVREKIDALTRKVVDLWARVLRPALEGENIFMRDYADLTGPQMQKADEYFHAQIRPVLTPLAVDPGHPFPFISNLSLSIGVLVKQPVLEGDAPAAGAEHLFARIKVPHLLSRWLTFQETVGGRESYVFMPIESLIEGRLDALFPGMEIVERQHFRVTRNAEVETEIEDPEDLLEVVQEELRARRFADTVRVQITSSMSAEMRQYLMEGLEVAEDSLYELPEPLGKSDLMSLALAVNRPDLRLPPWKPDVAPALADPAADIFALIRQGDILVHHPYESFDSSVERFILTAVNDPKVVAIKMTLYRTSGDSPFVTALARAAEAGKQVAVLVEVKARFDEERNIQWARTLEEAGAHVVYGVLGLKTHTKTALVVRREDDRTPSASAAGTGLKCYVHLATGNYNSKTAQLYTDLGLFTCREDICEDVVDLFAFLTGRSLKRDYRKLLVAPLTMRHRFLEMIEREIKHARAGKKARLIAKMNALEDIEVINTLYKASQAGVQIDLIVRGFCCLRPGMAGLSENIHVCSVIGRFLEHSRIFYFLNDGGPEEFFMGSADWMNRNLSHRVEAAVPIEDPVLQARLKEILDVMLADNREAWDLAADGTWTQRRPKPGEPDSGTHQRLMELTLQRAKKLPRAACPAPVSCPDCMPFFSGQYAAAGILRALTPVSRFPITPRWPGTTNTQRRAGLGCMAIIFYLFAALVLAGAGVTCFSRNILASSLGLLAVFVGIAGFYFLLHAEFLAAVQLAVSAGGLTMVILCTLAVTRKAPAIPPPRPGEIVRAVILASVIAVPLVILFLNAPWRLHDAGDDPTVITAGQLGAALLNFRAYLLPLELMAVVLVSVMIGAAYLVRTRRPRESAEPPAVKLPMAPERPAS